MARHGDRRGFDAPQRSPEELAETLARLAESTGGPAPRHGRRPSGGRHDSSAAITADPPAPPPSAPTEVLAPRRAPRAPRPESLPPPPAVEPPVRRAETPPGDGLIIGTPLGEAAGARLGERPRSTHTRTRASNGASAGPRVRSRAAGRSQQRRRLSAGATGLLAVPAGLVAGAGGLFGGATRRLRTSRPRSARPDARSRKLRRLYVPLLLVLALVILIGLLDQGKGHGANQPAHSATPSRSVFPQPSTIPTATQPTPTAPAVVTPPATVATTAHKRAPVKRPAQHPVARAKPRKTSPANPPAVSTTSPAASTSASSGTTVLPAPVYRVPAPRYIPPPARQSLSGAGALAGGTKSLTQRRARHRKG